MDNFLLEIQNTLDQLKIILKQQKDEIIILIKEQDKKEQEKKDYKNNIKNYIKYNELNTINNLEKIKIKENEKMYKEQINHSKLMINEFNNKKYNKKLINNLEEYINL
tara:strand:- start:1744 stop:2067 length:324 start_codon:yes stop_codon:yes gene_type:complete